jgi:hypothetical protein
MYISISSATVATSMIGILKETVKLPDNGIDIPQEHGTSKAIPYMIQNHAKSDVSRPPGIDHDDVGPQGDRAICGVIEIF